MFRTLTSRVLGARLLHTTQPLHIDPKTVEEVRIPVPWGHIAGKWWGDQSVQPVIALHGLADNAATYDTILPLLETPSVLAIDLPGHGKSSHISPGFNYDFQHNLISVRYLIVQHFKWSQVDFLAHSFGSATSFAYSGLFPKDVRRLISLDCARFNVAGWGNSTADTLRQGVARSMGYSNLQLQELSFEEHLKNFMELRGSKNACLSRESAIILLNRNLTAVGGDKYVQSIDPRLPLYNSAVPLATWDELAARIECHYLAITFSLGVMQGHRRESFNRQVALMKSHGRNITTVELEGEHHDHLEEPDVVAPHINAFLKQTSVV